MNILGYTPSCGLFNTLKMQCPYYCVIVCGLLGNVHLLSGQRLIFDIEHGDYKKDDFSVEGRFRLLVLVLGENPRSDA